jgi:hypothetical protein
MKRALEIRLMYQRVCHVAPSGARRDLAPGLAGLPTVLPDGWPLRPDLNENCAFRHYPACSIDISPSLRDDCTAAAHRV